MNEAQIAEQTMYGVVTEVVHNWLNKNGSLRCPHTPKPFSVGLCEEIGDAVTKGYALAPQGETDGGPDA